MASSKPTFPDPSITLVEFDRDLGVLLAGRTEQDAANKRLVLKKVAYVRLGSDQWGASPLPEVHIRQDKEGVFMAYEPQAQKVVRYPSKIRYEVAFLPKDLFDAALQCIKQRDPAPLYELIVVTFGERPGFEVEEGALVAPSDYASLQDRVPQDKLVPLPPAVEPARGGAA